MAGLPSENGKRGPVCLPQCCLRPLTKEPLHNREMISVYHQLCRRSQLQWMSLAAEQHCKSNNWSGRADFKLHVCLLAPWPQATDATEPVSSRLTIQKVQ